VFSQQVPTMANPYQVRPFAVDPKRVHRGSLSPDDAAAMSGRRYDSCLSQPSCKKIIDEGRREGCWELHWLISDSHASHYDNTETFFQQVKANKTHVPRTDSLGSLDSIPSRRSSSTSWVSNYTQHTIPSPVSATFSLGSKPSNPSLQRLPIFKRIPQEVYDRILGQLQELHSDRLSPSCATCYMRDLVALQLTSRSWDKAVRKTL